MKTRHERYEVLLNRLKSWERERATNRFKLAHVADVSIARLREEMERRWPGT